MAYKIYVNEKRVDPAVLLILQALNVMWESFYRLIMDSTKEYSELTETERWNIYESSQQNFEDRLKFDEQSKPLLFIQLLECMSLPAACDCFVKLDDVAGLDR